ncbi:MAG: MsnO8 family LLM class oxidoreductase [Campylobacter sp.]|nr:MsnO8 family LLM class oxidoreductase [Campylobacter sp.]
MRVSIHDLVTRNEGESTDSVFARLKDMVKVAENLGFCRYWFSEHHNINPHTSTSPELLIAYFSAITDKIRLGSGGTMIMHYSPLKIAENFKTLISLAPNRVDIGLGRAPGGDAKSIIALSEGREVMMDELYEKIEQILAYFKDEPVLDRRYKGVNAIPTHTSSLPSPWMLGSSGQSALAAAKMGLGYSFAKFFGVETPPIVFENYRRNFIPSEFFDKPEVMSSYMIVIADSKEEADFLAKPIELMFWSLSLEQPYYIKDPENLKDFKFTQAQQAMINYKYHKRFFIKGTKEYVASILEDEIQKYNFDEVMAYSPIFYHDKRINSYKKLAEILL